MIKKFTVDELARMVDHTFVKAFATEEIMKKLCDEAKEYHFAMAAINSGQTVFCRKQLDGTDIHVGAAIGFPLGQTTIESKVFETKDAIDKGADEIDYTINITEVKAKNWEYVEKEMDSIVSLCKEHNKISKVILETAYLTKEEIIQICKIATKVGITFVKTSTGFDPEGATVENIRIMKRAVDGKVNVKASGGIRDAKKFKEMVAAGATRIGTSAGVSIIEEFKKEAALKNGFVEIDME